MIIDLLDVKGNYFGGFIVSGFGFLIEGFLVGIDNICFDVGLFDYVIL